MLPICANNVVVFLQRGNATSRYRFLANVKMTKASYLAYRITLSRLFFKSAVK